MSRIYSTSNKIKFTDIPERYAVPRKYIAKQSEVHSSVITYVYEHYKDTKKFRQSVVDALNCLTYCVMNEDPPPFNWAPADPLETMPDMDMDLVESTLGDYFLVPEAIIWDVPVSDSSASVSEPLEDARPKIAPSVPVTASGSSVNVSKVTNRPLHNVKEQQKLNVISSLTPTPKEDLYIQPPRYPRFDVNKVWMSANAGNENLVIYTTLPEIPTCQNEISITTNLDMMTDSELMALYPNRVIHTRSQKMYDRYEGIEYDEDLGCIFPISGFTLEQVKDNIVRYPHLYKVRKVNSNDGSISKFFSTLEVDGELIPISDVWDSLPESKVIPRDSEFVKEYVIRRYLLEEDKGIHHSYRIFGTLDPFLTLFMPCTKYIEMGYKDTLSIVKQCVTSRIHYKQSRSPILRRLETLNG